jgi:ATP-dependent Lon protease
MTGPEPPLEYEPPRAPINPEPWRAGIDDQVEIVAPDRLAVLALRDTVLFPGSVAPIDIARPSSVWMVRIEATVGQGFRRHPLIAIANADQGEENLPRTVCAARIVDTGAWWRGRFGIVVQGVSRARIERWHRAWPYRTASVTFLPDAAPAADPALTSLMETMEELALASARAAGQGSEAAGLLASLRTNAAQLADCVASNTVELSAGDRQRVLEETDVAARVRLVAGLLGRGGPP